MKKTVLDKLLLPSKIVLGVFGALSLFGQISCLLMTDVDFLYYFPQNLYGFFFLTSIFYAFLLNRALCIVMIAVHFLIFLSLYLIQIFYARIRAVGVRMIASILLCVMLICDAIILFSFRSVGNLTVPAICDLAAIVPIALITAQAIAAGSRRSEK